ncbi:MAG: putative phage polymerase [Burkholderiales bacterium]|nr:putative phage polymerase [Burkholderiales bacterium]
MARSLEQLRRDAKRCQDCPLWANATQTVFGAGDPHARVMLVGEQPGDEEDRKGLPFVGPAGRLLDRALEAAGVRRDHIYITNAVKHFKWQPAGGRAGKRRLHKTPAQREIDACHQWLEREVAAVRPQVIVCLGAIAARAVISKDFKVSTMRGRFVQSTLAPHVFATFHPSALLRLKEETEREAAFQRLVKDLRLINKALS